MSYEPLAHSVVGRALAQLGKLPAGTALASAVLAEQIGTDSASLNACMQPAIRHGLVGVTKNGRLNMYSLRSNKAPAAEQAPDDEADDAPPQQRHVAAASTSPPPTSAPASVFHQGGQAPGFAPTSAPAAPKKAAPRKPSTKKLDRPVLPAPLPSRPVLPREPSVSCAVFNTGELLIELPGQPCLRLNPQQSADLLRWLQRVQPTIPMETI